MSEKNSTNTLPSILARTWLTYVLGAFFAFGYLVRISVLAQNTTLNPLSSFIGLSVGSFAFVGIVYVWSLFLLRQNSALQPERMSLNIALLAYAVVHVFIGNI